ncbi:MAG: hypothetical protein K2Q11_07185 [Burkholderiaceae bacterium]|nr:hypothetical protein [Burkholderiaceae bacterium]
MAVLQRFTTEYIETEDRLRLTGELEQQKTVVVWLSLRLLQRLLPHLLQWLQQQDPVVGVQHPASHSTHWHDEVWHGFAQQAAQARLPQQAPVLATQAQSAWLAHSIDVAATPEHILLTFKSAAGEPVELSLAAQPLRQWLGIVHNAWRLAQWPAQVWPQWMHDALVQPSGAPTPNQLH